ncbi:11879_t:CDS:2 [Acaulospora morrowiae]|uniref:11879_t:CDS:1 n=1 Tax=Acaulospora morrowiae TaxID=94023 RepID=A0A9N9BS50_9GLOM|nr:11879_t:CDS:2 [Acaulospora morrowiae]
MTEPDHAMIPGSKNSIPTTTPHTNTPPPGKIDPSPKTVNKLTDQPDSRTTANPKH